MTKMKSKGTRLTDVGLADEASLASWLMFCEFLLVKLAEYQAQEALAPAAETRELISLVQKILELPV